MERDFAKRLSAFFDEKDIDWRILKSGLKAGKPWAMVIPYVTNRAIQARLDEVCGIENWKNCFRPGAKDGVLCGISIRIGAEWITKFDGADNTGSESSQSEPVKGGLSQAMKRAAVQWGIGRYFYDIAPEWALFVTGEDTRSRYRSEIGKEKQWHGWNPPLLPKEYLPCRAAPAGRSEPESEPGPESGQMHVPADGEDLFADCASAVRNNYKYLRVELMKCKVKEDITAFQKKYSESIKRLPERLAAEIRLLGNDLWKQLPAVLERDIKNDKV